MVIGQCLRQIFSVPSVSLIWGERVLLNKTGMYSSQSVEPHLFMLRCVCCEEYSIRVFVFFEYVTLKVQLWVPVVALSMLVGTLLYLFQPASGFPITCR